MAVLGAPITGTSHFAISLRGRAHRVDGRECQDAYAVFSGSIRGTPFTVAAVADGVSDCRLSSTGANCAVRAATSYLASLFCSYPGDPEELRKEFESDSISSIRKAWHQLILSSASLSTNPVAELKIRDYACTLLVALVTPDVVLIGQIGDGDVRAYGGLGTIRPFPPSDEIIGTRTYHLALKEPARHWRTHVLSRTSPLLVLLATDGIDVFESSSEYDRYIVAMEDQEKEFGIEALARNMPRVFEYLSTGSSDDMTLVWLRVAAGEATPGGDASYSPAPGVTTEEEATIVAPTGQQVTVPDAEEEGAEHAP